VRLFKRQQSEGTSCPRCSQIVADSDGDVCPVCGWDVREAYQGPATLSHSQAAARTDPTDADTA
jgi:RNA polymerase subunit RPABC4/transcription elongation factor Spt4